MCISETKKLYKSHSYVFLDRPYLTSSPSSVCHVSPPLSKGPSFFEKKSKKWIKIVKTDEAEICIALHFQLWIILLCSYKLALHLIMKKYSLVYKVCRRKKNNMMIALQLFFVNILGLLWVVLCSHS